MASERFSLSWDDFHKNMSTGLQSFLEDESMVDVTLAMEGKQLKAHKMILSLSSPYFRELFMSNPCQHPIVFLKDVSYKAIRDILKFIYHGEVQVEQVELNTFIKTAEALQIKGLTEKSPKNEAEANKKKVNVETPKRALEADSVAPKPTMRKFVGPASKRPKVLSTDSSASDVSDVTMSSTTSTENLFKSTSTAPTQSNSEISKVGKQINEGNGTNHVSTKSSDQESKGGTGTDETSDKEGNFKFVYNQQGTLDLILHQHVYRFDRLSSGTKVWKCAGDNDCSAKCYTSNGKVQSKIGIHSHSPPTLKEDVVYKKLD